MSAGPRWNLESVPSPCCGAVSHVASKRHDGLRKRRCSQCGKGFYEETIRKSRSCGSGVRAGTITIGRGSVWGAGLA